MKINIAGLYFLVLLLSCASCAKESQERVIPESKNYTQIEAHYELSERDAQVGQIALALSKATAANVGLRKLIGEKALKQFDGDYDVLMEHIVDEPIEISDAEVATKAGTNQMDFKSLIEAYLPAEAKTKAGETPLLQQLMEDYPELQIAVPVHAEEWDPEQFSPPVVFNLLDKDVEKLPTIPGFDAEGNPIEMDAVNAPDYPVIVVGYNERMGREPDRGGIIDLPVSPDAPVNLACVHTNTSIILTWDQFGEADGFSVYKRSSGMTTFSLVATITDGDNRAFEDFDVDANQTYLYYVKAFVYYTRPNGTTNTMESEPSSIVSVSAPNVLPPLSSFSVLPNGTNLEFRWNNDGDVTSTVKVDYNIPSQMQYYNFFSAVGQVNKIMAPPVRGQRVSFMAYRQNSLGMSDAIYDCIYPPFRNTGMTSSVDISGITYGKNPESWVSGKPEFYLKAWIAKENGSISTIQQRINIPVKGGVGVPTIYSGADIKHIYDWFGLDVSKLWYETMAIALVEEDYAVELKTISFSPQIAKKVDIGTEDVTMSFSTAFGCTISFEVKKNDEDCGQAYFYYFKDPESVLCFPVYQVSLQMTENH